MIEAIQYSLMEQEYLYIIIFTTSIFAMRVFFFIGERE